MLTETAQSPAARFPLLAGELRRAGPGADWATLPGEAAASLPVGRPVLDLTSGTRNREARALLDACVPMRTPANAARAAAPDPHRLVPLLLTAARGVSDERHGDLLHALHVAGFAA